MLHTGWSRRLGLLMVFSFLHLGSVYSVSAQGTFVHVDEDIFRHTSVKFPFCKSRSDRIMTLRVEHHVPSFADDPKYIGGAAYAGWRALGNWKGDNYCTPGQLSFLVRVSSYYNGAHVSDADVEFNKVGGRLQSNVLNVRKISAPPNGNELSQLRQEILGGRYGTFRLESPDFKFDDVLKQLEAFIGGSPPLHMLSKALYLMGSIEELRVRADGWFALTAKAKSYYQRASDLGHPIATLKLLKATGLTQELDRIFFNAQQGKALISSDIAEKVARNHSLFVKGLDQNVGRLVAYGPALTRLGVAIEGGQVKLAEAASPYASAIDHAMNRFLKDSAERGNAILGFKLNRCDGTWCEALNGSVRMRFVTIGEPSCAPSDGGLSRCSFELRWVLGIDQKKITGFPNGAEKDFVNSVVNSMARGNVMLAKAEFRRRGSQWIATNNLEIVSEGKAHNWRLP